jgi:hypothetical protein
MPLGTTTFAIVVFLIEGVSELWFGFKIIALLEMSCLRTLGTVTVYLGFFFFLERTDLGSCTIKPKNTFT